jgi:hypothetical protein
MTQWVENPTGGRERGPRGLLRAWVEILVRPTRFFRNGVAPGDQAPGLAFGMGVVLVSEAVRLALVPEAVPEVAGGWGASALLTLAVATVFVAPLALHLVAAVESVALVLLVPAERRAGVSETVQVVAYAAAPCVLAGVPVPAVRVVVAAWGALLLALGTAARNDASPLVALAASVVPAALVFGYGFRGFAAAATLIAGV